jgi:serine/threonine-protein kinase
MGELYEAEDLELQEHVALKVIRREIAQDAIAIKRFKREVHLTRPCLRPSSMS